MWQINQYTLQAYGKNNIIEEIRSFIENALSNPYTHKIEILDVHVNKEIYQPKQYRYLGGLTRFNEKKNEEYIQYFKAWNATFNYKGFNLDMNNDVEYECVPSALYNTYGIKKEKSYDYLHCVYHGKLDYVKSVLNRNNASPQEDKTINYINPYDEMIKNDEKMIKEYFNQYEYDTDYELDIKTVDDIKDEDVKEEIQELYESINEFKIQKDIIDNQFKIHNKQNKKGYSSDDIIYIDTTFFLGYQLFSWDINFFPGIYYTRIFGSEVSIRNSNFSWLLTSSEL